MIDRACFDIANKTGEMERSARGVKLVKPVKRLGNDSPQVSDIKTHPIMIITGEPGDYAQWRPVQATVSHAATLGRKEIRPAPMLARWV